MILVTEGFQAGQVGSSAMPHKMNTRSCERVNGFMVLLRGYQTMAADLAGSQWNEGDVYCSVVRRVVLPDAFFAFDGMLETMLTVLDEFGVFEAVVQRSWTSTCRSLRRRRSSWPPCAPGGPETAHEVIKENAVAAALDMRATGCDPGVLQRLAEDPGCPGCRRAGRAHVRPTAVHGAAASQVRSRSTGRRIGR